MSISPFTPQLQLKAQAPMAGVALINGTQNAAPSWTAPNDGQVHMVMFSALLRVTSAETGGAIGFGYTEPDGTVNTPAGQIFAGGAAAGNYRNLGSLMVQPGSTVTFQQNSALTAGAGVLWLQVWAA